MKEKNRVKLFMENMIVYGVGGAIGKIIPFILLPIITRMLPSTYYYGLSDLVDVLVSFGASFSVLGMYDIMFRMFFEKEDEKYKKIICSSTMYFVLINAIILCSLLTVFSKHIAYYVFGNKQYFKLVIVASCSIFFSAMSLIISAPTRMKNEKEKYLIINSIIPFFSYGFSMILLNFGYYEYALPLVTLCNYLLLTIIFWVINHTYFELKLRDWVLIKKMLKLSIPLVPNFVIYWVFNSCDKLMINKIINTEAAGVYGVGAKLGHMSQLIYSAFAGGWQYFAFSTMKDDDQVELTSKVFEYLGILTFLAGIIITIFSKAIFSILFTSDYAEGYIVMPYLFIAPLLLMLFQTAGNQFLVIKKTWPTMFILFVGAIVNLGTNLGLIPVLGIEGAAIGTLLGYVVSVIICVCVLKRNKLLNIYSRFIKATFSTCIFYLVWRTFTNRIDIVYELVGGITICYLLILYKRDIGVLYKKVIKERS